MGRPRWCLECSPTVTRFTYNNLTCQVKSIIKINNYLLQQSAAEVGELLPPITASGPQNVTGELDITQSLVGALATADASSRGLTPAGPSSVNPSTTVAVGTAGRR